MQKTFNVLMLILGACLCLQAEDIITLRTGEDIAAKILEVSTTEIKYKRMDNVDGPTFVVPVSEVLIVRYENGSNQVFEHQPKVVNPYAYPAPVDYGTAGKVVPGMRYNEYRHLYNPSDYVRMPGDSHSPVAGGICSFLIPGLGQMICGEVGRGFAFFGDGCGCRSRNLGCLCCGKWLWDKWSWIGGNRNCPDTNRFNRLVCSRYLGYR